MGKKKSTDGGDAAGDPVCSLFATENPFRRKPTQLTIAAPQLRHDAAAAKEGEKTKKKHPNPIADDVDLKKKKHTNPIAGDVDLKEKKKKRTSLDGEEEETKRMRKRKMKREEIEDEYEKRRFGSNEEKEAENKEEESKRRRKKEEEIEDEYENRRFGSNEEKESENKEETKRRRKKMMEEIEDEYEKRRFGSNEEKVTENKEEGGGAVVVGRKRNAEEMVEKEEEKEPSFDDEAKLLRTVFVGNLPLKTKKKALLKEFAAFGSIDSVRIRSVPIVDSTTMRKAAIYRGKLNDAIDSVHAYIVFKDEQSAKAALAHNMTKFGGNHIRVDMACPPRQKMKGDAPMYSVKKTVFVGNLPFDVKDEELYQLFCEQQQMESSLEAVRVIRDPQTSAGKGIAYVMFKTRDAANKIVKRRGVKLRDRELRLSHARSDTTPSKRKAVNHGASEYPNKRTTDSSWKADRSPKVEASSLSYQGVRSSKSGVPKKAPRVHRQVVQVAERHTKRSKEKVGSYKRPAVAAKKARALEQAGHWRPKQ